jgi:hypothetical protein
MADMQEVYDALRKADAEGDTESVAKLSAYIKSQSSSKPELKLSPEQIAEQTKKANVSFARGQMPGTSTALDFFHGATGIARNAAKAVGINLDSEYANPKSTAATVGSLADPLAYAIGGNAMKAAGTIAPKIIPSAGPIIKGMLGGAGAGTTIGALSDEGDAGTGLMTGAAVGAVIPPIVKFLAKGTGLAIDAVMGRLSDIKAGKVIRDAAGDKINQLLAVWKNATGDLTAAQAAEPLKITTISALGERAKKGLGQSNYYSGVDAAQNQALDDLMRPIMGGANQAESLAARARATKNLQSATNPILDIATNTVEAQNSKVPALSSLIGGDAANFSQFRPSKGLRPLTIDSIAGGIDTMLSTPRLKGNSTASNVVSKIKDQLVNASNPDGTISVETLHELRKSGINNLIEAALGPMEPKAKADRIASILSSIKPMIDDAITKSGGPEWMNFLDSYSKGMRIIDRMKLGSKAMEMLQSSPDDFIKLASNNKPKVLKDIFGPNIDIATAMGEQNIPIQKIASVLSREKSLKELAAKGTDDLNAILKQDASKPSLVPNLFNAKVALAKQGATVIDEQLNKKAIAKVYNAMKNGKDAAKLMETLSTAEKNVVLKAMINGSLTPYLTTAGIQGVQQ